MKTAWRVALRPWEPGFQLEDSSLRFSQGRAGNVMVVFLGFEPLPGPIVSDRSQPIGQGPATHGEPARQAESDRDCIGDGHLGTRSSLTKNQGQCTISHQ
jgi:hypothetical protein